MNPFDPNAPSQTDQPESISEPQPLSSNDQHPTAQPSEPPLSGDPISLAAATPAPWPAPPQKRQLPEDLQVSWSWPHFILFILFAFFSLAIVQTGLLFHYVPLKSLSNQKEVEGIILSKPAVVIGTMVIWYGLVLLFLYVTLAVLRNAPFWRTLGWRTLKRRSNGKALSPWLFLLGGSGLSFLVFIASAKVQPPENAPIEELFKYKNTALYFMAMAVLIAPLVEETVFRGYLYPLFAKSFGVAVSVIVTGILFGILHGAQLGWSWGLVGALVMVGIVFTFVRARTGTVFTSFLLHLGYNSTIAIATVIGMLGLAKTPATH